MSAPVPVCKYFVRGSCKFGDNCWYQHPGSSSLSHRGYGNITQTFNRYQALETQPQQQHEQSKKLGIVNKDSSVQEIMELISLEARVWLESKMWQLSCYGYLKDGPCLDGFDDVSPEELRQFAYESMSDGKSSQYEQELTQRIQVWREKIAKLINPSADLGFKQKLMEEIQAHKFSSPSSRSIFGNQTSGSTFGAFARQGASVFPSVDKNRGQSSVFGGSSTTKTFFGGASAAPTPPSLFGASSANKPFFSQHQSTSGTMFGGNNATSSQNTMQERKSFFTSPAQSSKSLFEQTQTQGSFFSNSQGSTSQQPQSFSNTPTPPSLFSPLSASSAPSLFSSQPANSVNFFNSSSPGRKPFDSPAGGDFATFRAPGASAATSSDAQMYTPLSELTNEEREQFEAEKFTLGKIPLRPPPRELVA